MTPPTRRWLLGLLLLVLLAGILRLTGLAAGQPPVAAPDQLLHDLSGVWQETSTGNQLILNLRREPKIFRSSANGGYAYPAAVEATIPDSYTVVLAVQHTGPGKPVRQRYVLVLVASEHSRQLLLTQPDGTTRAFAWERALSSREAALGPTRFVVPPAPPATAPAPQRAEPVSPPPEQAPALPQEAAPDRAQEEALLPQPEKASPAEPKKTSPAVPEKASPAVPQKALPPASEKAGPTAPEKVPPPAAPVQPVPDDRQGTAGCAHISSPHRRSLCESPEFARADAALNATFSRVMAALPPHERKALQREEDAWVRRKQQSCGRDTDCMLAMTRARTNELLRQLP